MAKKKAPEPKPEPKRPEFVAQQGQCRAAVFQNSNEKRNWYTISLSKTVRTADGQFKESHYFAEKDLPDVSNLASRASEFCEKQRGQTMEGTAPEGQQVPSSGAEEFGRPAAEPPAQEGPERGG